MKKTILAVVALTAFSAAPAMAANEDLEFTWRQTVDSRCAVYVPNGKEGKLGLAQTGEAGTGVEFSVQSNHRRPVKLTVKSANVEHNLLTLDNSQVTYNVYLNDDEANTVIDKTVLVGNNSTNRMFAKGTNPLYQGGKDYWLQAIVDVDCAGNGFGQPTDIIKSANPEG
jgi:hypothetical protein